MNKTLPHHFYEQLQPELLATVSDWLLGIHHQTRQELSSALDDNYTRGATSFGRQRQIILQNAISGQYPWLSILHGGMDITFSIGGVPVRFFSDDPSNPQKRGFFRRNPTDSLFSEDPAVPVLWRFVIDRAMSEEQEDRVFFIGYDAHDLPVCEWQYSSTTRTMYAVGGNVPHAKELGAAPIELRDENEAQVSPAADQSRQASQAS